jgi:hypothetical protein
MTHVDPGDTPQVINQHSLRPNNVALGGLRASIGKKLAGVELRTRDAACSIQAPAWPGWCSALLRGC